MTWRTPRRRERICKTGTLLKTAPPLLRSASHPPSWIFQRCANDHVLRLHRSAAGRGRAGGFQDGERGGTEAGYRVFMLRMWTESDSTGALGAYDPRRSAGGIGVASPIGRPGCIFGWPPCGPGAGAGIHPARGHGCPSREAVRRRARDRGGIEEQ